MSAEVGDNTFLYSKASYKHIQRSVWAVLSSQSTASHKHIQRSMWAVLSSQSTASHKHIQRSVWAVLSSQNTAPDAAQPWNNLNIPAGNTQLGQNSPRQQKPDTTSQLGDILADMRAAPPGKRFRIQRVHRTYLGRKEYCTNKNSFCINIKTFSIYISIYQYILCLL